MTFEYAASFPRDAEQRLHSVEGKFTRVLGLFYRDLIKSDLSIESKASADGYEYKIVASQRLIDLVQKKINSLPQFDRAVVDQLKNAESDSVEIEYTSDRDNEPIIGLFDRRLGWIKTFHLTGEMIKYLNCLNVMRHVN